MASHSEALILLPLEMFCSDLVPSPFSYFLPSVIFLPSELFHHQTLPKCLKCSFQWKENEVLLLFFFFKPETIFMF